MGPSIPPMFIHKHNKDDEDHGDAEATKNALND